MPMKQKSQKNKKVKCALRNKFSKSLLHRAQFSRLFRELKHFTQTLTGLNKRSRWISVSYLLHLKREECYHFFQLYLKNKSDKAWFDQSRKTFITKQTVLPPCNHGMIETFSAIKFPLTYKLKIKRERNGDRVTNYWKLFQKI